MLRLLRQIFVSMTILIIGLSGCGSRGSDTVTGPQSAGSPSVAARTTPLSVGNVDCPNGGVLVQTGIDDNKNGVLDAPEVDQAQNVCNGAPGANGLNALVSLAQELAGSHCPVGGVRIDTGTDSNGDGMLDPAEVTSTAYVCSGVPHGWGAPVPIEPYPPPPPSGVRSLGGPNLYPQVAISASGHAVAVWGGTLVARFVPGTGWEAPTRLTANGAGVDVRVAVNPTGDAIVVWGQSDGTQGSIWASRFVPDVGWNSPKLLETDDAGAASAPQIAMDADGNAIVVWQQSDGTRENIWATRFSPESGWDSPTLLETDNAGPAIAPQITMNTYGDAVAVWQQSNGTQTQDNAWNIWATRFIRSSGWERPTLVETNDAGEAIAPHVAMDAGGNATVVWQQYDGVPLPGFVVQDPSNGSRQVTPLPYPWYLHYDIWAARFVPGTGWDSPTLIETDTGDARSAKVAMDASGHAITIWTQAVPYEDANDPTVVARFAVLTARFVPGTGWESPTRLENNPGSLGLPQPLAFYPTSPQIAMDPTGRAIAVWQQSDGSNDNIWATRFLPGTGWEAPVSIGPDAGWASLPQVAVSSNGEAIAVWQQNYQTSSGSISHIWANRFVP